jgi:hypothetical protein
VGVGSVLLGKLTKLRPPAAIVVSGGNIDDARFTQLLESQSVGSEGD